MRGIIKTKKSISGAERVAYSNAVFNGHRSFKAVCITSDLKDEYCSPCGVCR